MTGGYREKKIWNSLTVSFTSFIISEISRQQRIAEIKRLQAKAVYGGVKEISAQDYVQEVNQAGDGVWVILHLYKQG